MRFEVRAAFAIGILLPLLETCRRGWDHWRVDATTMLEDYAAGVLLLGAALAAARGRRHACLWLLVAWSAVTGMMSLSLVGQIEVTLRGVELEPRNAAVVVVKLLLWATCMASLVQSFRRAQRESIAPP